jgi:hypothetical protein
LPHLPQFARSLSGATQLSPQHFQAPPHPPQPPPDAVPEADVEVLDEAPTPELLL